jgi:hypothetical protein
MIKNKLNTLSFGILNFKRISNIIKNKHKKLIRYSRILVLSKLNTSGRFIFNNFNFRKIKLNKRKLKIKTNRHKIKKTKTNTGKTK